MRTGLTGAVIAGVFIVIVFWIRRRNRNASPQQGYACPNCGFRLPNASFPRCPACGDSI